jgi:hypothetical protein
VAASVQTRTLQRLFEMFGSRAELARALGVAEDELGRWLSGEARPPMAVFTRAVAILLDETEPPGSDAGPAPEPPAERGCSPGDPASSFC